MAVQMETAHSSISKDAYANDSMLSKGAERLRLSISIWRAELDRLDPPPAIPENDTQNVENMGVVGNGVGGVGSSPNGDSIL